MFANCIVESSKSTLVNEYIQSNQNLSLLTQTYHRKSSLVITKQLLNKPVETESFEDFILKPKTIVKCNAILDTNTRSSLNSSLTKKKLYTAPDSNLKKGKTETHPKVSSLSNFMKSSTQLFHSKETTSLINRPEMSLNLTETTVQNLLAKMCQNCFDYLPLIEKIKFSLLEENIEHYVYSMFREHCSKNTYLEIEGLKQIFQRINIFISHKAMNQIVRFLKRKSEASKETRINQMTITFSKRYFSRHDFN